MTTTDRVILIQGDADKWYEQAIFIVKPGAVGRAPVNMVEEAEGIIAEYLAKKGKPLPARFPVRGYAHTAPHPAPEKKRPRRGADILFNAIMVLACLAMAGVLAWGLLS